MAATTALPLPLAITITNERFNSVFVCVGERGIMRYIKKQRRLAQFIEVYDKLNKFWTKILGAP